MTTSEKYARLITIVKALAANPADGINPPEYEFKSGAKHRPELDREQTHYVAFKMVFGDPIFSQRVECSISTRAPNNADLDGELDALLREGEELLAKKKVELATLLATLLATT